MATPKKDILTLAAAIECLADNFELMGVDGQRPGPLFEYDTFIRQTRYYLRTELTEEALRERAARLKTAANRDYRSLKTRECIRDMNPKINYQQARFSKAIYEGFIEDGELENAEEYKALYAR